MLLPTLVSTLLLSATVVTAGRSLKHVGNRERFAELEAKVKGVKSTAAQNHRQLQERQASAPKFLNANTTSE
jgi:hypothetical protein